MTGYDLMASLRFMQALPTGGGSSVSRSGAQNEFESFQVAVTANTTITGPITLTVSKAP